MPLDPLRARERAGIPFGRAVVLLGRALGVEPTLEAHPDPDDLAFGNWSVHLGRVEAGKVDPSPALAEAMSALYAR